MNRTLIPMLAMVAVAFIAGGVSAQSKPVAADSAQSEPVITNSEGTEPGPTDPAQSEPAPANLVPSEPAPSQSAQSKPVESAPGEQGPTAAALTPAAEQGRQTLDPAAVGLSANRLQRLTKYLHKQVNNGVIPGAVVAIARHDKVVYLQAFGHRDPESRDPMPVDALFDMSTLTEPVTAVGALVLQERGDWLLSDSVGRYLSDFKRRPLRLMDLLRHSGGLPRSVNASDAGQSRIRYSLEAALGYTGSGFSEALAKARSWTTANQSVHEGFSYDLLGVSIEKVTGQTLGAYLLREVFIPLDMWDTGFNASADQAPRMVRSASPVSDNAKSVTALAPVRDLNAPVSFDCGGACLYSSASDYLRFARFLLNKGALDGKRVLSRISVNRMTQNRLGHIETVVAPPDELETTGPSMAGFGFGVSIRANHSADSLIGSSTEYSRAAPTGPYFWVDPNEQLAVVALTALPDANRRTRFQRAIRALVLQAIDD